MSEPETTPPPPRRPQPPWVRRTGAVLVAALVGLVGAWLALAVGGTVRTDVGPVQARLLVTPAWTGDTVVDIPPLGSLRLDTHDGPLALHVDVTGLDPVKSRQIFRDPSSLTGLEQRLVDDLQHGLVILAVRASLVALAGATLAGLIVLRRPRRALVAGGSAFVVLLASGGLGLATWNPKAINEPAYSGLLTSAPSVVGDVQSIVGNFSIYREQLAKIVTNVSKLYDATLSLPTFTPSPDTIRVLLVSDIHLNPAAWDVISSVSRQFQVQAIIDAGDISDHGLAAENQVLEPIRTLGVPYVWVRGNHDSMATQDFVEGLPNGYVLDNSILEIAGLRIIGVGDPRFTPDKDTRNQPAPGSVIDVGQSLADQAFASALGGRPVDVAVMHDPDGARLTDGTVPLALAGHVHHRDDELLAGGTRLFVEGSTGGSSLRALEGDKPTPIELSVLYFDRTTKRLQAWDDVRLGGLGQTSATIERHQVPADQQTRFSPIAPGSTRPSTSPGPEPTATPTPPVTPLSPAPTPTPSR
jgi:predicted phosphodiesterase